MHPQSREAPLGKLLGSALKRLPAKEGVGLGRSARAAFRSPALARRGAKGGGRVGGPAPAAIEAGRSPPLGGRRSLAEPERRPVHRGAWLGAGERSPVREGSRAAVVITTSRDVAPFSASTRAARPTPLSGARAPRPDRRPLPAIDPRKPSHGFDRAIQKTPSIFAAEMPGFPGL